MDTKQQNGLKSFIFWALVNGNHAATPPPSAPEFSRAAASGKISARPDHAHRGPHDCRGGEPRRLRSGRIFESGERLLSLKVQSYRFNGYSLYGLMADIQLLHRTGKMLLAAMTDINRCLEIKLVIPL